MKTVTLTKVYEFDDGVDNDDCINSALEQHGQDKNWSDDQIKVSETTHTGRVIDEQFELSEKLVKLSEFIDGSPIFGTLPLEEQDRLVRQARCMTEYSNILLERIAAFPAFSH